MKITLLVLGCVILGITFSDFFHTTLSGHGFGKISGKFNDLMGQWVRKNRNNIIFKYSGLLHVLSTSLLWLLLLVLGSFILFSSGSEMVINSETKESASLMERLYYSGFVISTLGIGDFIPGNKLSQIITTFLSFSGFILLTTALTYLISVVNTVLQKKQLALYISTLGSDIRKLHHTVTAPTKVNFLLNNANTLREMIIKNSSNYIFFPIVQYYLTDNHKTSVEVQLVRLYEVLTVMSYQAEPGSSDFEKINTILATINSYLDLGLGREQFEHDQKKLQKLRIFWTQYGIKYQANPDFDKRITISLESAGWTWDSVYELGE